MGKYTPNANSGSKRYFKMSSLDAGPVRFRMLVFPYLTGVECWADDKTPVRAASLAELLSLRPANGWRVQKGKEDSPRDFIAGVGWNYSAKEIQVALFTQATVLGKLESLENNEDWGDPTKYDLKLSRELKANGFYEYSVDPCPHKPVPPEAASAWKDLSDKWTGLSALLSGGDPFKPFDENIPF